MVVNDIGVLVLADDQMTIGRNGKIVSEVELRSIARFDEVLKRAAVAELLRLPPLITAGYPSMGHHRYVPLACGWTSSNRTRSDEKRTTSVSNARPI